jgi:hypothetical protein
VLGLNSALAWIDDRAGYGGASMVSLTPNGAIFYFDTFADHETAARIHCLHRANRREVSHYLKAIQQDQPVSADT